MYAFCVPTHIHTHKVAHLHQQTPAPQGPGVSVDGFGRRSSKGVTGGRGKKPKIIHRGVGGEEVTVVRANLTVLPHCPAAILKNLVPLFTF